MKSRCASCLILGLLLAAAACGRKDPPARQIIALIDVSASIEPAAQQSAFQAIENIVPSLRRGDSFVLIPITGDAGNESQGRILRLSLAERREAYDQDLRRAAASLRRSLEETRAQALRNPGAHTDILGALRLAAEEIRLAGGRRRSTILILSDLVQDDSQFDFNSEPALKNESTAQTLALESAHRANFSLKGAHVFLGLLRSKDLRRLSPRRRAAIQDFWVGFANALGGRAMLAEDGPGLLSRFLTSEIQTGPFRTDRISSIDDSDNRSECTSILDVKTGKLLQLPSRNP